MNEFIKVDFNELFYLFVLKTNIKLMNVLTIQNLMWIHIKEIMKEKNNIKQKIFDTGFSLYIENPLQFSVMNVAKKRKMKR